VRLFWALNEFFACEPNNFPEAPQRKIQLNAETQNDNEMGEGSDGN
jgi:hypothetical protein